MFIAYNKMVFVIKSRPLKSFLYERPNIYILCKNEDILVGLMHIIICVNYTLVYGNSFSRRFEFSIQKTVSV
jgi:hypothetical protein